MYVTLLPSGGIILEGLGVSPEVLRDKCDPEKPYGVYRYDGIPVPIPDAGIPLEVVERARHRVENNRSPARGGDRLWELSKGILRCAKCGRAMQVLTMTPRAKSYNYYYCQSTRAGAIDPCTMRTHIPAEAIEEEVLRQVSRLMDDKEYVLTKLEEHFALKRKELKRSGADVGALMRRVADLDRRRDGYYELAADGDMPRDRMREKVAEIEQELEEVERELAKIRNRDEELGKLKRVEAEMRRRIEATENHLAEMTPEKRRELYEDLRLRVEVGADKSPSISGVFPIRIADTRCTLVHADPHTTYVVTPQPVSDLVTPREELHFLLTMISPQSASASAPPSSR